MKKIKLLISVLTLVLSFTVYTVNAQSVTPAKPQQKTCCDKGNSKDAKCNHDSKTCKHDKATCSKDSKTCTKKEGDKACCNKQKEKPTPIKK